MVTKKYVWVLCDDDKFDFSHFKEISQAMEQDYDVILASNYAITDKYSLTQLVKQLTLVPAGIYKTKLITSTVLMNAYFNISNIFPQLALVCKAINDNCSFYIPKHGVVQVGIQEDGYSYTRGCDEENNYIHPSMKNMFWQIGFINSVQMIKDKKKRKQLIRKADFDHITFKEISTYSMLRNILFTNKTSNKSYFKNTCDVFSAMPFSYRTIFLFLLFDHYIISNIIRIRIQPHKISFCFFTRFKTSIRLKPKEKVKNNG